MFGVIKVMLFLSVMSTAGSSYADFRIKPWNESSWTSYDKYVHCASGWILTNQLDKSRPWWQAALIGQGASLVWEIKDGFLKWEEIGYWGGDGFDLKDHIAFTVGQLTQGFIDHIIFKKSIYNPDKAVKKRLNKDLYKEIK